MTKRFRNFLPALLALFLAVGTGALSPSAAQASAPTADLPRLSLLLDASTQAKLAKDGKAIAAAFGDAARLTALPLAHPAMDQVRAGLASRKPGILVEALFIHARPEPSDPSGEVGRILAALTDIGSLQGIEYWSASRKTMRTFYAESWRIDGPLTRLRVADVPPPPGTGSLTLFTWQRDLSFGGNVYRYDYRVSGEGAGQSILLTVTNLTKMSYGFLPVLPEQGLQTQILIIPAKEGIVFYAASAADTAPIPILGGKLQDSFTNRAEALFRWFSAFTSAGS
jgi:hypothetical protein